MNEKKILNKHIRAFENVNIGRRDYYWLLTDKSQYHKKIQLTKHNIQNHLNGIETLGMTQFIDYTNVLYLGIDIDCHIEKTDSDTLKLQKETAAKEQLYKYAGWLSKNKYLFYVNSSGSPLGWHIKIYSNQSINAEMGRAWLKYVSKELLHIETIPEIFPKQDKLDKIEKNDTKEMIQHKTPYGNQMKLVLGLHPKHKKQAVVLDSYFNKLSVIDSLDFFIDFEQKMKKAKEISFEITKEIRSKYIKKKHTLEELKELKKVPIPTYCPFIEEIATKDVLPSESEINRHTALDPNVFVYCTINNKLEQLNDYMTKQGRSQDAFNNSAEWVWSCKPIQNYITSQNPFFVDNNLKERCNNVCSECKFNKEPLNIWGEKQNGDKKLLLKNLYLNIHNKNNFITIGTDIHTTYHYNNGIYVLGGENKISILCENETKGCIAKHQIKEVLHQIQRNTYKSREDVFEPKNLNEICVDNGVLNISTRKIKQHTPDLIFTQKIPIIYDKTKKCDNILKFVSSVLEPSDVACFQEFLGYLLYRKYIFKKSIIFVGEKDTGKTTLLKLILKFIGDDNTSGVSLHVLSKNLFSASKLEHKLFNYYDDLSLKDISDTSSFKIACGGGKMSAEHKFGESFEFYNYAKLLFATNKFVSVPDIDDDAYYGRWMIFFFNNVFTKKNANPNIIDELVNPDEMSGLLNWALDGLNRLLVNNSFTYQRSAEDNKQLMLSGSDSLCNFIQNGLIQKDGHWVSKQDMYNSYLTHCRTNNFAPVSMSKLGSDLVPKSNYILDGKKYITGKQITGWNNVVLLEEHKKNTDFEVMSGDKLIQKLNLFATHYKNNELLKDDFINEFTDEESKELYNKQIIQDMGSYILKII